MLSAMTKKLQLKNSKWIFNGFSIFLIGMLVFITINDLMTGESSNTVKYYTKSGFLASPEC